MNELEKEIGKQLTPFIVADKDREGSAFKKGADFVLSKNLPVLFIEWWCALTPFYKGFYSDKKKAYDYWINNIYGK